MTFKKVLLANRDEEKCTALHMAALGRGEPGSGGAPNKLRIANPTHERVSKC